MSTPVAKMTAGVVWLARGSGYGAFGRNGRRTLEEDDGGVDPAHGPEVDGAILPFKDLARVVRLLDVAGVDATRVKIPRGLDRVAAVHGPLLRHLGIDVKKSLALREKDVVVG